MFQQLSLDPTVAQPRVAGWFARAAPRLTGALTLGGWRLEAAYQLDYRGTEVAGSLLHQEGELTTTLPRLGPLAVTVGAALGRFDAPRFADEGFVYLAGEAGLRLEMGPGWRLSALYRPEARRHTAAAAPPTSGTETGTATGDELIHLAELLLVHLPEGTVAGGRMALTPMRALGLAADGFRLARAGPEVELVRGRVTAELGGWLGAIEATGQGRTWQVGAGVSCVVRLAGFLDAAASYHWTAAPWAAAAVQPGHARRLFLLSVVGHASARKATTAAEPPRPDGASSLRPLVAPGGRVRFRLRAGPGAQVQVIGSWNDWATPGAPLAWSEAAGLWEATVPVGPGTHRYRFLVDGRALRPPDSERYLADDFGQEDGVIEVAAGPRS